MIRRAWIIGVMALAPCFETSSLAFDTYIETGAVGTRAGSFIHANGWLASGGVFWAPELTLVSKRLYLGARAGAWLLKDRGGTPAFSPSVTLTPRLLTPLWGISISPSLGGGFTLVLDKPFAEYGASIDRELEQGWIGISSVGIQCSLIDAKIRTYFVGLNVIWRW
jgi:hypothetical protein